MFPAARISDPLTHDQLVPSGLISVPQPGRLPNVLIENMPAAVVGDFVACTGATSAGPVHPPQTGAPPAMMPPPPMVPISTGSGTVLINNRPAGRWMVDVAGCGVFLGSAPMLPMRTTFICS